MLTGTFTNETDRAALDEWMRETKQPSDGWTVIEDHDIGPHNFRVDEEAKELRLGAFAFGLLHGALLKQTRGEHELN